MAIKLRAKGLSVMNMKFFNQLVVTAFIWVVAQPLDAVALEAETADLVIEDKSLAIEIEDKSPAIEIEDKSPADWLQEMIHAIKTINYRGQFSHQQQTSVAFEVVYGLVNGKRFERLRYLGDRKREMIRYGDDVTFVVNLGDDFVHHLAGRYPSESFGNGFTKMFAKLPDQYQVRKGGVRKLAGRQAVIIDVTPKRLDRYSYKLWLDRETALLLRFEQLDMERRPLELFSFEQIDINVLIGPEETLIDAGPRQVRIQLKIDNAVTEPTIDATTNWNVGWTPEGFAVGSRSTTQLSPEAGSTQLNIAYSDGLSAFSVYIEKLEPGFRINPRTQISGGTTTVIRQVQDSLNRLYTVVVVGEIPATLAERIAQSVSYSGSVSAK